MRETRVNKPRGAASARFALGAAALLGLLVAQVAGSVGASADQQASSSASLSKQVKKLKKRVASLEGKPAPTATGPAGGDLTGSYPNPIIATGALAATDLGQVISGSTDLASVPAGSCVSMAVINFAGADGGDFILAIPSNTIGSPDPNFDQTGELIVTGIPHSGEGHIKACNVSNAAIDPPSQTWKAVLIQG